MQPTDEPNFLGTTNTTWEGKAAYNPRDLFIAYPTKPHTYKMFGRLSDRILLATGEAVWFPLTLDMSKLWTHMCIADQSYWN